MRALRQHVEAVPAAIATPGAEQVSVQVTCAVTDLEPLRRGRTADVPVAAFVGTVRAPAAAGDLRSGGVVCGVGPLTERVSVTREHLTPVDAGSHHTPEVLALVPFAACLAEALGCVGLGLGERVGINGRGLAARLVTQLAGLSTGSPARTLPDHGRGQDRRDVIASGDAGEVDLLVDTTTDALRWAGSFPLVREQGRVLLILPPGPQHHAFDFYPAVHRRSLSLSARRVPGAIGSASSGAVRHLLDQGRLTVDGMLASVRAHTLDATGGTVPIEALGGFEGLVWWFGSA